MFILRVVSVVLQRHVLMSLMLTTAAILVISPAVFNLKLTQKTQEFLDPKDVLVLANREHEAMLDLNITELNFKISSLEQEITLLQNNIQNVKSALTSSTQKLKETSVRVFEKDRKIKSIISQIEKYTNKFTSESADIPSVVGPLATVTSHEIILQKFGGIDDDKSIRFGTTLATEAIFSPQGLNLSSVDDVQVSKVLPEPSVLPEVSELNIAVIKQTKNSADLVPEKLRLAMLEEWSAPLSPSPQFQPQASTFALGLMGGGPEPIVLTQATSLPYGATDLKTASGTPKQKPAIFTAKQGEQILNNGVLTQAPLDFVAQFTAPKRQQTAQTHKDRDTSASDPEVSEETVKRRGFFARLFGSKS